MKIILKGTVQCLNCGHVHFDSSMVPKIKDDQVWMCHHCGYVLIDLTENNMIVDKVKAESISFEDDFC